MSVRTTLAVLLTVAGLAAGCSSDTSGTGTSAPLPTSRGATSTAETSTPVSTPTSTHASSSASHTPTPPPSVHQSTAVRDDARPPAARWRLTLDSGESLVVEGLTLLGRRPEGRVGEPVRHTVPLPSKDMSVSKTHAQLHIADDGALVVMDRGSTNGSTLVRSGVSRELPAGKPTSLLSGDEVRLGDRVVRVYRED